MPVIPMLTLPGVDASARRLFSVNLERAITYPSGLIGAWRFGFSVERSLVNEYTGAGTVGNATLIGSTPTLESGGLRVAAASCLTLAAPIQPPYTVAMVYLNPSANPSVSINLSGYALPGGAGNTGLLLNTVGNLAVLSKVGGTGGVTTTATRLKDASARAEFVVGTFDTVGPAITLHRPRTANKDTAAPASFAVSTYNHRILGSDTGLTGSAAGIREALFNRVLTDAEIAALYLSMQTSLADSGIAI